MLKRIILSCCMLLFVGVHSASAQQHPPPVRLYIQNIPQETQVWCWAAVAQQIIYRVRGHNTPPQCEMVAIANNTHPGFCCNQLGMWNGNQSCFTTGNLQQIQYLIAHYGGRYSSIAQPTDPMTIYNALLHGRPIIMSVKESPYSQIGHVVVITGMEWIPTLYGIQPVLHVNDPARYFTEPVHFANIAQYWQAAIVVH